MVMTAIVWILTYAIHSTVLIVAVWVLTKVFTRMSLSTQESLWKAAILGGVATATLQLATGATPPWGHFQLPAQLETDPVAVVAEPAPAAPAEEVTRRIVKHDAGDLTITTIRDSKPVAPAAVVTKTTPMKPSPWPWVLLGLVVLGSVFALVRLGLSARRLSAKLKGRRQVIEDPVLEAFLGLCEKAELKDKKRVKLTASAHLRSPVALRSREIVLPERAVEQLTPPQQQAMVAHELAHVLRRDPSWSLLTALIEAVFFFQPLNHLARRKIRDTAEFQCDDWAARHTGTGVHLAKCLAEVAAWLEDSPGEGALAVSMADDGSPIVRRITRLLHGKRARSREDAGNAWFALRVATTIGLLGLVAWLVPGVSRAAHPGEPSTSTADGAKPETYAAVMQADRAEKGIGEIVVRELGGEGGKKRSQVRIDGKDEVVRVEVEREPEPPPPPPAPEPPRRRDSDVVISIHGGLFGFGWGDALGWIELEAGDDNVEIELHGEIDGFPFGCLHGCGHRHFDHHLDHLLRRADRERERERAQREAERMRRRLERDAERARRDTERARERIERARDRIEALRHRHDEDDEDDADDEDDRTAWF